jgi:uncharacterized membrane protein
MKQKTSFMIILCLVLISFALGIITYPYMPSVVASHWDAAGNVNGYMGKFWGVFLLPVIVLGMAILFLIIPLIDPMKENFKKFRKYFDGFIILILAFMIYVQIITILWNLGYALNFNITLPIGFAILFYYAGILIENSKRNWFVGIRTPWTLSSDNVWNKTHKLGGKLFKIAAVISLLSIFFPRYSLWIVLIPIISFSIASVVYSYVVFIKEKKKEKKKK